MRPVWPECTEGGGGEEAGGRAEGCRSRRVLAPRPGVRVTLSVSRQQVLDGATPSLPREFQSRG